MMTDKPLVPPKTLQCPLWNEYIEFVYNDKMDLLSDIEKEICLNWAKQHRASCELCKARMEEFNELARNAKVIEEI